MQPLMQPRPAIRALQLSIATAYASTANSGTGSFTISKCAIFYANWKTWAQSFGIQKMCGYEGGYSPDYTGGGQSQVDILRAASKQSAVLSGLTTLNYNNFVGLSGGGFVAEFPSCFQLSGPPAPPGGSVWSVLEDVYQTPNPPHGMQSWHSITNDRAYAPAIVSAAIGLCATDGAMALGRRPWCRPNPASSGVCTMRTGRALVETTFSLDGDGVLSAPPRGGGYVSSTCLPGRGISGPGRPTILPTKPSIWTTASGPGGACANAAGSSAATPMDSASPTLRSRRGCGRPGTPG